MVILQLFFILFASRGLLNERSHFGNTVELGYPLKTIISLDQVLLRLGNMQCLGGNGFYRISREGQIQKARFKRNNMTSVMSAALDTRLFLPVCNFLKRFIRLLCGLSFVQLIIDLTKLNQTVLVVSSVYCIDLHTLHFVEKPCIYPEKVIYTYFPTVYASIPFRYAIKPTNGIVVALKNLESQTQRYHRRR